MLHYPGIRLLLLVMIGIGLGHAFPQAAIPALGVSLGLALGLVVWWLWDRLRQASTHPTTSYFASLNPFTGQGISLWIYGIMAVMVIALIMAKSAVELRWKPYTDVFFLAGKDAGRYSPVEVECVGSIENRPRTKTSGRRVTIEWTLKLDSIAIVKGVSQKKSARLDTLFQVATGKVRVRYYINQEGSAAEALRIGDRISLRGRLQRPTPAINKGEFDYAAFLQQRGIDLIVNASRPEDLTVKQDLALSWYERYIIVPSYDHLSGAIERHVPEGTAQALLKGIILGEKQNIDKSVLTAFQKTGTVHVLTVSGLHVGLLLLLITGVLRRLKDRQWGRWVAFVITAVSLILFSNITGDAPPVKRAVLMAIMFELGSALQRPTFSFNSLGLANVMILILTPSDLFSGSFHLTNGAVIAIIIFFPKLTAIFPDEPKKGLWGSLPKWVRHIGRYIWEALALTLAATIGTAPFVAYYFGAIPLFGLIANLPVVLLANFAAYSIAGAALTGILSDALASCYAQSAYLFSSGAIGCAIFFSTIPNASTAIAVTPILISSLYAIALTVAYIRNPKVWPKWAIVGLLCMTVHVWKGIYDRVNSPKRPPDIVVIAGQKEAGIVLASLRERYIIDFPDALVMAGRIKRQLTLWYGDSIASVTRAQFTSPRQLMEVASTLLPKTDAPLMSPEHSFIVQQKGGMTVFKSKRIQIIYSRSARRLRDALTIHADVLLLRLSRCGPSEFRLIQDWMTRHPDAQIVLDLSLWLSEVERKLIYTSLGKHSRVRITERDGQVCFWKEKESIRVWTSLN